MVVSRITGLDMANVVVCSIRSRWLALRPPCVPVRDDPVSSIELDQVCRYRSQVRAVRLDAQEARLALGGLWGVTSKPWSRPPRETLARSEVDDGTVYTTHMRGADAGRLSVENLQAPARVTTGERSPHPKASYHARHDPREALVRGGGSPADHAVPGDFPLCWRNHQRRCAGHRDLASRSPLETSADAGLCLRLGHRLQRAGVRGDALEHDGVPPEQPYAGHDEARHSRARYREPVRVQAQHYRLGAAPASTLT